jgi:hypothetical protein
MATTAETTALSQQYDTPLGLAHTTMQALKDRIKLHYDLASDYYLSLWYVEQMNPLALFLPSITKSIHGHMHTRPQAVVFRRSH